MECTQKVRMSKHIPRRPAKRAYTYSKYKAKVYVACRLK